MLEDGDDKIRRNVIVAAGLVLAAYWLEIPVQELVDRLIGVAAQQKTAAFRVWVLVDLVLIYLGSRYWFSDEPRRCRRRARLEWALRIRAQGRRILRQRLWLFNVFGLDSRLMHKALGMFRAKWEKELIAKGSPMAGKTRITVSHVAFDERRTDRGALHVTVSNRQATTTGGNGIGFEFPRGVRASQHFAAMVSLLTLSRSSTELFVPIGTWVCALAVASWRIIQLW